MKIFRCLYLTFHTFLSMDFEILTFSFAFFFSERSSRITIRNRSRLEHKVHDRRLIRRDEQFVCIQVSMCVRMIIINRLILIKL